MPWSAWAVLQLTCPEEIQQHVEGRDTAVEFVFTEAAESEPDLLIDSCLSWILAIGQRGTGGRVAAVRVELKRPPKHRELLEKHYGCRVKFKAGRNAIVFRSSDMDLPLTTYNARGHLKIAFGSERAGSRGQTRRETRA